MQDTYKQWKKTPLQTRIKTLLSIAKTLQNNTEKAATLITQEMGKPITESRAEVEKCIALCHYYAENAETLLTPPTPSIVYEPTGTILAIMPWNYPLWQVFRFAIPTLLAGNTVLLKHAPNVPKCAQFIETLFTPILKNIQIDVDKIETLIADSQITGVTLTGSVKAGSSVAALAGKHIKPCVLELGGSDPFIICEDADLPKALDAAIRARLLNNGQTCISAKRFLIHKTHYQAFIDGYLERLSKKKIGNPLNEDTDLGPLARADIKETLQTQLDESLKLGAKKHTANLKIPEKGNYFEPCLLTNLTPNMPVLTQETFGPIAVAIPFTTTEEAIQIANQTHYGLGASIWTQTPTLATQFATEIQAGNIAINQTVTSLFHLPFGGTKSSGIGRELGTLGLTSFCNIKTIVI